MSSVVWHWYWAWSSLNYEWFPWNIFNRKVSFLIGQMCHRLYSTLRAVDNHNKCKLKASAHSFKRLTSWPFLKISFSLCTYYLRWMSCLISFKRCQLVQLKGTRNKWSLQKNLVHGRIRTPKTARRPDYKSTVFITRILQRYEWRN